MYWMFRSVKLPVYEDVPTVPSHAPFPVPLMQRVVEHLPTEVTPRGPSPVLLHESAIVHLKVLRHGILEVHLFLRPESLEENGLWDNHDGGRSAREGGALASLPVHNFNPSKGHPR